MKARDYLRNCRLLIWKGTYSVCQVHAFPQDFVAAVRDQSENTVVALTGTVPESLVLKEEPDWKIITFETTLPFELTGFLATVTNVLAERKISVFAISAFSTDHIMVKNGDLEPAVSALEALGCQK